MIIESTYGKAREQLKNFWIVRSTTVEMVLVRRRSGGTVAMIAADER
jgi:antitoxin YefM